MLRKSILGASLSALVLAAAPGALAADEDMAKMGDALSVIYEQAVEKDARAQMEAAQAAAGVAIRAEAGERADDIILGRQLADDQTLYVGPITDNGLVVIDAVAANGAEDLAVTIESPAECTFSPPS
ncbi:MAG: hypothetical protein AAGJ87_17085, partial [Pseudomonadota bacterium]